MKSIAFVSLLFTLSAFAQQNPSTPNRPGELMKPSMLEEDNFAIGPYRNGVFTVPVTEEEKQKEEALLEGEFDETHEEKHESRVNRLGPQKM